MASAVLEVPRMKKILSKKLQLRSTTIATLIVPHLRNVKGGTNDGVDDGGGNIGGTTNDAGIKSDQDGHTRPEPCNIPITTV
jgi:hypothetical protein